MEAQEIFDTVAKHLFKQGCRAEGPSGCAYRGKNGLKCAVGIFIPDEVYDPRMDEAEDYGGTGIESLLNRFREVLPPWFVEHRRLLMNLQDVHDGYSAWIETELMKKQLKETAERFELDDSILNTLSFSDGR